MEIKPITREHDAAIAELVRSNLKANSLDIPGTAYFDPSLNSLSEFYAAPNRAYFVLISDGVVLGGAGLAEFSEDCCELQKLYLADEAKGKGLGRALTVYVENKARELGYKRIYLETHSNLKAAIRLYEKMGYRPIPRPDSVVHGTMDRFYIKSLYGEALQEAESKADQAAKKKVYLNDPIAPTAVERLK